MKTMKTDSLINKEKWFSYEWSALESEVARSVDVDVVGEARGGGEADGGGGEHGEGSEELHLD